MRRLLSVPEMEKLFNEIELKTQKLPEMIHIEIQETVGR